jgi:single-stranded-DNA-specific exonuclease
MASTKKTKRRWRVIDKTKKKLTTAKIVTKLLKNRGIKTKKDKEEFFSPVKPEKISLRDLGIKKPALVKAIKRIEKAKDNKEKVIIYGDYDADGICATAILWECLYSLGIDALPYIPERFSEGYGIKGKSVKELKKKYSGLGLVITVDNGIVAKGAVEKVNKLGIDVIVTDHHQKGKKLPKAHSIIHTVNTSGSAISWIFARELRRHFKHQQSYFPGNGLELVAIGTIADQIPLIGVNRSFAKFGLEALNATQRVGLLELFKEARVEKGSIGSYTVGFIIAPRINAMGRMKHAIDSLRLLCTKSPDKAKGLANYLGKTNAERQKIVDEVVVHARESVDISAGKDMIVISHEKYHEGVIGLAAAKLVDEFWRPAIVLSRGKRISKASARSIPGFNIIEAIRKFDSLLEDGGGHPMAAGFSIKTDKIDDFSKKIQEESAKMLTESILTPELKIDMEIGFDQIKYDLVRKLKEFEPVGLGNPTPSFVTKRVKVQDARLVGSARKHLKLSLEKDGKSFGAIGFGLGEDFGSLSRGSIIDTVYSVEENYWNGDVNIQLKIKDIRVKN